MLHVFTDESLDPVEIKSTWKRERSVAESGCQTREIHTETTEVQSYETDDQEVQTDLGGDFDSIRLADYNSNALADFLHDVEPMIMKCLTNNLKTRAFDGFADEREASSEVITCIHTLFNSELKEKLQITSLSWNTTGSTLAASYGRFDHEDWCTHRAALCTWNLDRRSLREDRADTVIDSPCCLMCLEFHPVNPAWLAGGNFNGEVILWDLSREDDLVLATSGFGDDAHREPVNRVHWIKDHTSKDTDYKIVSISGDGKVLIWKVEIKKGKLRLSKGFLVMSQDLPKTVKVRGIRGNKEVGATCISFNHEDPDVFILGSESGCVFKCSLHAQERPAGNDVTSSVPLWSPVTFTFNPHSGPIHSVDCSRFHRNAFLSAGMDQSIRLYNVLQAHPMLIIEPGDGYLFCAKWSPVRPVVLAVGTENGNLLIYDMRYGQMVPAHKLEASPNKHPIYSLQFNTQQKHILATGDGQGYIKIFRLGEALTSMSGQEIEILENMMKSGKD